jgi:hypothetical protein
VEQPAVLREGHEMATVQSVAPETSNADQKHESGRMMSMMHGSSPWHWLAGGMMVVMMVVIAL